MTYYDIDIREHLRQTIGTVYDYDDDGTDEYCITVTDDYNDTVYLPMFLPGEARSGDFEYMPFIEITLTASPTELHNTQGDVNYLQGYFDLHIWYTNTDNITPTVFGRQVASALVQSITSYNKSVTSSYIVEVIDSGKEINENLGVS